MYEINLTTKDWIYFAGLLVTILGLLVTIVLFLKRLRVDGNLAAIRETVSYLEKKSLVVKGLWTKINVKNPDLDDVKEFFGELDQMALLVNMKAFDTELVYNFWWKYFYDPLAQPPIKSIFESFRQTDKTIFVNYIKLCEKWRKRIQKESGYL